MADYKPGDIVVAATGRMDQKWLTPMNKRNKALVSKYPLVSAIDGKSFRVLAERALAPDDPNDNRRILTIEDVEDTCIVFSLSSSYVRWDSGPKETYISPFTGEVV